MGTVSSPFPAKKGHIAAAQASLKTVVFAHEATELDRREEAGFAKQEFPCRSRPTALLGSDRDFESRM